MFHSSSQEIDQSLGSHKILEPGKPENNHEYVVRNAAVRQIQGLQARAERAAIFKRARIARKCTGAETDDGSRGCDQGTQDSQINIHSGGQALNFRLLEEQHRGKLVRAAVQSKTNISEVRES